MTPAPILESVWLRHGRLGRASLRTESEPRWSLTAPFGRTVLDVISSMGPRPVLRRVMLFASITRAGGPAEFRNSGDTYITWQSRNQNVGRVSRPVCYTHVQRDQKTCFFGCPGRAWTGLETRPTEAPGTRRSRICLKLCKHIGYIDSVRQFPECQRASMAGWAGVDSVIPPAMDRPRQTDPKNSYRNNFPIQLLGVGLEL